MMAELLVVKQVNKRLLFSGSARLRLSAFVAGWILLLSFPAQSRAQVAPAAAPSAPAAAGTPQTTTAAPKSTADTRSTNPADARNRTRSERDTTDTTRRLEAAPDTQEGISEFQQMVFATTGRNLTIFGASLFDTPPTTFAPTEDVNVGPGYIIGPGDELQLQLSGQVNDQLNVTVDRTGAISLPQIGSVHVAGLPFGQLGSYLRAQMGKIYRNFDLSVNLGSLRTIQVFVVGQARRPGSYSISSLSTLLNALFVSGGPLPQGSVRDIQVKRGGQTITHFDLYDLLLHGDKSHDVNLATGDVIFIPMVGPQVALVGSVSNPAVYELKGDTTAAQALALAGGETNVAAGATIRLERVYDHTMRSVEDVSAAAVATQLVRDGDILSVASIVDRFKDAVTLRGNVANPGRYVWHPGMRISDLIPNKAALITRNYWRKRNLLGQPGVDYIPNQGDSEGALLAHGGTTATGPAGTQNQRTTSTPDSGGSSVGAALTPESTVFSAQTDVILSAPDINLSYAVIERQSSVDLTTSLLPFNLGKVVIDGDPSQNLELLPGDVITIFSKADLRVPSTQQTRIVHLEGEFIAAGVYTVLPGETLRGLLRRAGGLTSDAFLYGSEFTRESTRRVEQQRLREYADQLEAQVSAVTSAAQARAITQSDSNAAAASAADAQTAVARLRAITPIGRIVLDLKPYSLGIDSVPDLALEDGDRFIVPRMPSNVTVEGQVYSANAFVYGDGRRVIDYLRQAGGPDRQADRKRTFVLRADGSVVSQQYTDVRKARIYPGDTIVVPPVIDKRATLQRIVDIATIVGQLGLGVATIGLLAR
jgi:polysaccharide biosynthesis/export protein